MERKVKNIYLIIFMIGLLLNFILSKDERAYILISLFGLIGFFVETIFNKLDSKSIANVEDEI
ncbi:hypothetical protein A500_06241 [Clostridium sartagoforme AAU1]|uniref:Uncharacterized protein n=1 Tax=Clostridium sartagoforme AAU1 TaxID=1202534 RepID=R9CCJ6_9CLOT|nr:hypothetical protein [Clostridium sartagoforme]EOR27017.1 hypothetical protein A500_06241 [Clostridium sartagoforme AAU1]